MPVSVDQINLADPVPAGGYDVAPAVNTKCIVFTGALAAGYWFLPSNNKWVLLCLLFFPYLFLSYYDVAYGARRNMGPTYLADFYDWLKVPNSKQIVVWKHWKPEYKARVHLADLALLVALLVVLPAFLKWQPSPKTETEAAANRRAVAFFGACLSVCVLCRLFLRASD